LRPPEDLSYIVQIFTSEDDVVAEGPERSRGEVSKGFDDGLSKAFELALTPAVLGVGGWLLDTRIGTTPLFTLVLLLLRLGTSRLALVPLRRAMRHQEQVAARPGRPPPAPPRTGPTPAAGVRDEARRRHPAPTAGGGQPAA
jgi:F0F1-type ATP synthase assembly protein I